MTVDLPKWSRVMDLAARLRLAVTKFCMIRPKRRSAKVPTQPLPATKLSEFVGLAEDMRGFRLLTGIQDNVRPAYLRPDSSIADDLRYVYTIEDLSAARRLAYKLSRTKSAEFVAGLVDSMVQRARRWTGRA